jgi:hypothetical protein
VLIAFDARAHFRFIGKRAFFDQLDALSDATTRSANRNTYVRIARVVDEIAIDCRVLLHFGTLLTGEIG